MGWRGAVRAYDAAVRANERDAKRRHRELEKRHKQYDKMQELERAEYEVEVYENRIDLIRSLHKECSDPVDWKVISALQEPNKPEKLKTSEDAARSRLDNYRPGFLDRIFRSQEKNKARLSQEVIEAIESDDDEYVTNIDAWEKTHADWKEGTEVAMLLLNGDNEAKIKAINYLDPFSEIDSLGSRLSLSVNEKGLIEATIYVLGKAVIPDESKSILKTGKLSVKKVPKGLFNEIYQDYVCSALLRVANELFSAIPDNLVCITAVDELLNTKTGHLVESPILSAYISRSTLIKLDMNNIDPSDSMHNFIHNMSFKKTSGFEAVDRVHVDTVPIRSDSLIS